MIKPPKIKQMYANNETILAIQPFSLCLPRYINPIAKNKKIIPAKDIYILSMEIDIFFTPVFFYANRIITQQVLFHVLKCMLTTYYLGGFLIVSHKIYIMFINLIRYDIWYVITVKHPFFRYEG